MILVLQPGSFTGDWGVGVKVHGSACPAGDSWTAAPTFKGSFGFHPIVVCCDNTAELLATRLRPGNAGANTTADHLEVLAAAITQIPRRHREKPVDPYR